MRFTVPSLLLGVLTLSLAGPAAAADVDAGALRAREDAGGLTFTQPGAPDATLRLASTSPARATRVLERVADGLIRVRRVAARTSRVWPESAFSASASGRMPSSGTAEMCSTG